MIFSSKVLQRWRQYVLTFFILLTSGTAGFHSAFAAGLQNYFGKTVGQIQVRGLKRIEVDAVVEKLGFKKGDRLDADSVQESILSLHEMGLFNDIVVEGELKGKQVNVTYRLKERPVISRIDFDGNDRIDTDELEEVIKVKEWSILDINRVKEDVRLIQKHYEDKGFYLAKVTYEVTPVKVDEVVLRYKVNDFEKVEIKKITFLNNTVFSDEKLKSVLGETREGGLLSFISGAGSFKETAFKQDLQRLTYWYLDNGYVKFRYENPVVTVSDDKRWLYISIYVDEGDAWDIGEVDFAGDLLFSEAELSEGLTMLKGEPFSISKRNADIQKLTEMYQDLGYAFVNVVPKMKFNEEAKTVDITYSFEKGHLVYFGEIDIVGNSKTHDKVIRRELRIHEGELYSGSNLRISRERVERLGFFQPGEVIFNTITPKGKPHILDVEIRIKERSTGTITLGAGYGSVTKFFFSTQVSEINLLGRGQSISLQAQVAADSRSKSFNLGFTDPYAFDTRWSMGGDLFFINFPIPNKYTARKLGFDVRFGYPITDYTNAFITYKNESLRITEKEDDSIDTTLDEGVLSSIVWSIVRDKRNNRFETTDGDYQSIALETAGLGGDKAFVKVNLNNRFYKRIWGNLVFRNSTEYGHIFQTTDRGIPPAERFYLGGPNNMKGFNIFTLGPSVTRVNSNGVTFDEPLGGTVQLFSLFELEYPIIPEAGLKIVMFYDIGNTFDGWPGNSGAFVLRSDAGFGFRWFSPIGPLRFEWGFPFSVRRDPTTGNPLEDSPVFNFFIGPPF